MLVRQLSELGTDHEECVVSYDVKGSVARSGAAVWRAVRRFIRDSDVPLVESDASQGDGGSQWRWGGRSVRWLPALSSAAMGKHLQSPHRLLFGETLGMGYRPCSRTYDLLRRKPA